MNSLISLVHMFLTGPYLMYIALAKPTERWCYMVLLLYCALIIGSVIYRYYQNTVHAWHFVHITLFLVLLGYTGFLGTFVGPGLIPGYLYSFLLAVGVAAIGYHAIRLYQYSGGFIMMYAVQLLFAAALIGLGYIGLTGRMSDGQNFATVSYASWFLLAIGIFFFCYCLFSLILFTIS